MAERRRLNLGNLNPIYERELNKLDVRQGRFTPGERHYGDQKTGKIDLGWYVVLLM